jgi:hypothetical protein
VDSCKKYWLDVQLRDRRNPVPANIARHQYLFRYFFLARHAAFLEAVLYQRTGACTRGHSYLLSYVNKGGPGGEYGFYPATLRAGVAERFTIRPASRIL